MKIFKALLKVILGLVVFVLICGFVILEWPQIIINRKAVAYVLNHSQKLMGQTVSWSELWVGTQSISFAQKKIQLHLGPSCFSSQQPGSSSKICFSRADIALAYSFAKIIPRLSELGPIEVHHAKAWVTAVKSKPIHVPSYVWGAKVEPLLVQLDHFEFHSPSGGMIGSANVRGQGKEIEARANVSTLADKKKSGDAAIHGSMQTASGRLRGPWNYNLAANYTNPTLETQARLDGNWGKDGIRGKLDQKIRLPQRRLRFAINDCRYSYLKSSGGQGKIQLGCPLALQLKNRVQPLLNLSGDLKTAFPYDANRDVQGRIEVQPAPDFWGSIKTQGKATADVDLVPADLPKMRKFSSNVNLDTEIPEFGKLVRQLAGTRFAIPAPLHALRGSARSHFQFSANQIDPSDLDGKGTLDVTTDLASPKKTQSLKIKEKGNLAVQASLQKNGPVHARSKVDLLLANVKIALPNVSPAAIQRLFPDPRLSAHAKKPKLPKKNPSRFDLDYSAHVHTPPDNPVVLRSYLTSAPVPIDIDVVSTTTQALLGDITIRKIPIKMAGVSEKVGRVNLHADTSNQAGMLTGSVVLGGRGLNKKTIQVPAPQAAGQAAGEKAPARVPPQFPIPVSEVVTSILLGTPLDFVQVQPGFEAGPTAQKPSAEPGPPRILQFRNRY